MKKSIMPLLVVAMATIVAFTTPDSSSASSTSPEAHGSCPICVPVGIAVGEEAGSVLGPVLVTAGAAGAAAVAKWATDEVSKIRSKSDKKPASRSKRRKAQRDLKDTIKLGAKQLKEARGSLKRLGKMWRRRFGVRYLKKNAKGAVGACVASSVVTVVVEFLFDHGHVKKDDVKKACVGASFGYLLTGHAKASASEVL